MVTSVLPSSGTASGIGAAEQKMLLDRLKGAVRFLGGMKVRALYEFNNPRELEDWFEYPLAAGRCRWNVGDGSLAGEGRGGIRFPWRFSSTLHVRVVYGKRPDGRLHLFDDGNGQAQIATDFRGIYTADSEVVSLLPWRKWKNIQEGTTVDLGIRGQAISIKVGEFDYQAEKPAGVGEGYVGIMCWEKPVSIDRIEIQGTLDPDWMKTEIAWLTMIRAVKRKRNQFLPIARTDTDFPWTRMGNVHVEKGKDGSYVLRSGDDSGVVIIGSRWWTDYSIKGSLYLSPGTSIGLRGRWEPRILSSNFVQCDFAPGKIRLSSRTFRQNWTEAPSIESGRSLKFQLTWFKKTLTVDIDGEQVLHSTFEGPPRGNLAVQLRGEGARVGGMEIRLLSPPVTVVPRLKKLDGF